MCIVREQQPEAGDLIFQRQRFGLEFDPIVAGDFRPHIQFRGFLQVRVPKLENDFRFAYGEARFVDNALPQDEGVIVESKVGCIQEHHLPDCGLEDDSFVGKSHTKFLRRLCHQLSVIKKDLCGREGIGLEDKLALEILNVVERRRYIDPVCCRRRQAVAIGSSACCSTISLKPGRRRS